MNIAAVIVDVPAKQTDREFDYLIPDKWKAIIQPVCVSLFLLVQEWCKDLYCSLKRKN